MDRLGSYRLRKRLAVGGMGEVYLGEKIGPEGFVKPVVLKCVLPQLASDRAFVQLFLDEARLAALLNHPNIAQVYDFGLVDDIYYIAMEYVPGYTVDDIRRKLKSINQFMPIQHIACIASQVCQGLHYAHCLTDANGVGLGLVHRDVSPHNLIVSIDGSVKIVDFGIAKARAGLTRVQAKGAVGKFGYMSPEQARGEVVDGRSDIFSLGICLWEILSNERLHDPNLDRAPMYSPTRPIQSVEAYRPEVPRQFTQILETGLSIEVDDRFPNCQEMHLALERFQAAMTHYAGQSALAAYIKDLVEGRIENPEDATSGRVVEPAGGRGTSGSANAPGMDAAQRYEEVFGVTMESKRPRPTIRAVPKSWETKDKPDRPRAVTEPPAPSPVVPARPVDRAPSSSTLELDLGDEGSKAPEVLEIAQVTPASRARPSGNRVSSPPLPAPQPRRKVPVVLILIVLAVVGLGVGAFFKRAALAELVGQLGGGDTKPAAKLSSVYRVETTPAGAKVFLDGEAQAGTTPMEIELIPDVDYRLTVKLKDHATILKELKAKISEGTEKLAFALEPSGVLAIVTSPPGATAVVDGREIEGVTPLTISDVPSGRPIKIRVEIKGMPPGIKTVKIESGKRKRVRIKIGGN